MKIRLGFVSNSSSTSYCINLYGMRLYRSDLQVCSSTFVSNLKQIFTDAILSGRHRLISQLNEIEEILSNGYSTDSEIEICTKIIYKQIEVPFQVIVISDYVFIGLNPGDIFKDNNFMFTINDIRNGLYDIISMSLKDCAIEIPKFEYFSQSYQTME